MNTDLPAQSASSEPRGVRPQLFVLLGALAFGGTWAWLSTRPAPPLEAGELRVRVLNHQGEPFECLATLWEESAPGQRRMTEGATKGCSPSGKLRWVNRAPGTYRLMVSGQDIVQVNQSITLGDTEGVDLGELRQGEGGRVRGRVLFEGEPRPGVQVISSDGSSTVAGPDGAFKLEGVPVGPLKLRSAEGQRGGLAAVDVRRGELSRVDIELQELPPYGVLGLYLSDAGDQVFISRLVPGAPASGVLAVGDVLTHVDGQPAAADRSGQQKQLAGDVGQKVQLRWLRGAQPMEGELKRASSRDY